MRLRINSVEGSSMPQDDMAQWVRTVRLAVIASFFALCLAGGAILLNGDLRSGMWGAAAGLMCTAVAELVNAYLRRGPADLSPAAASKKARRARVGTIAALILAASCWYAMRVAPWPTWGFLGGAFAFVALWLSPLFGLLTIRRAQPSPLSRMTSAERAARTPTIEPSRQQDSR
jgi:hypothetical protein